MHRDASGEGINHPFVQPQMQRAISDEPLQIGTALVTHGVVMTEFGEITSHKDDRFGIFQMAQALTHEHAFVLLAQVAPGRADVIDAADGMHEILEISDTTEFDA